MFRLPVILKEIGNAKNQLLTGRHCYGKKSTVRLDRILLSGGFMNKKETFEKKEEVIYLSGVIRNYNNEIEKRKEEIDGFQKEINTAIRKIGKLNKEIAELGDGKHGR